MIPAAQAPAAPRIGRGCLAGSGLALVGLALHLAGAPATALLMLLPLLPLGALLGAGWHPTERLVARPRPRRWGVGRRPAPPLRPAACEGVRRGLLLATALAGRAPPAPARCR